MRIKIIIAFAMLLMMSCCGQIQAQTSSNDGEFDITRYLDQMQDNPELRFAFGGYELKEYALVDIDRDGKDEVWVRDSSVNYQAIYAIAGDSMLLIAYADGATELTFYEDAVKYVAYYSPGRSCEGVQFLKDSKLTDYCMSEVKWNIFSDEQEVESEWYYVNGEDASEEEYNKFLERLGEPIPEPKPEWRLINLNDD